MKKILTHIIKRACKRFNIEHKTSLMLLTRPRGRNHHRANPSLKVTKMWIGLPWTRQKDVPKKSGR
jgi:hypothetical protein